MKVSPTHIFLKICILLLLSGCAQHPQTIHDAKVFKEKDIQNFNEIYEEIERVSKTPNSRHVWIEGGEKIILPQTASADEATEHRTYTFDVFVDISNLKNKNGAKKTLQQAIADGDIEIDVLGCEAKVQPVAYQRLSDSTPISGYDSRHVVRIYINSQDLSRSITIFAWRKSKFNEFEKQRSAHIHFLKNELLKAKDDLAASRNIGSQLEQIMRMKNPWAEIKKIQVYGGDLITSISMVSEPEVIDAFGKNFNKYFYVGKVYFKNRHQTKKLVINTTSLRAKCLFYREPNPEAAKAFLSNGNRFRYLLNMYSFEPESNNAATDLDRTEIEELIEYARFNSIGYGKADRDKKQTILARKIHET